MLTEPSTTIGTVILVLSVLFNIYQYFRKPQEELDKKQAVDETQTAGNILIIQKQIEWEKRSAETRFADMGKRLDDAFALAQNHTHTIDVKVDELIKVVNALTLSLTTELTKLQTIINERMK